MHKIKCLECDKKFSYEFSKEEVKNWSKPSLENMEGYYESIRRNWEKPNLVN